MKRRLLLIAVLVMPPTTAAAQRLDLLPLLRGHYLSVERSGRVTPDIRVARAGHLSRAAEQQRAVVPHSAGCGRSHFRTVTGRIFRTSRRVSDSGSPFSEWHAQQDRRARRRSCSRACDRDRLGSFSTRAPQFEGVPEGGPYSATSWIRVAPPEQVIEPGKEATVRFSMSVPPTIYPGGYSERVCCSSSDPPPSTQSDEDARSCSKAESPR